MATETPGGSHRPAPSGAGRVLDGYATDLRCRVLDELAVVRGRIDLASHLDPASAKEQLRVAHSAQRAARLADAADWLTARETTILQHFADGREVDPARIDPFVTPVRTPLEVELFRFATLQWSVPVSSGYGRRTRFIVTDRQNGKLMAIFALGDPVIAQGARDTAIGWDKDARNARLYNVYDAFVLGAVEPYRQLLAGKLAALLTISNETRGELIRKYHGNTPAIGKTIKDPTPVLITTSSALGRSSVYNRVTYDGNVMLHSVGFTKGFGHFQFSDALFADLREYVRSEVLDDPRAKVGASAYGNGPNWRFRVIRTALNSLGIAEDSLKHNVKREMFLAPAVVGWDKYLRGESQEFQPFDLPVDKISQYYRERWAIPRAERMPGYRDWRPEEGRLTPLLVGGRKAPTPAAQPTSGYVGMGAYDLNVGTAKRHVRGRAPNGLIAEGVAYMSRLEGPGELNLSIADIEWATGEREVRGWDRHNSDPALEAVVGRLRVDIYRAERFRSMSSAEIRPVAVVAGRSPAAAKTTAAAFSERLGFDVAAAFDELGEATVGTREKLLHDTGRRRGQLCAIFTSGNRVVPATLWALTRAVALNQALDPHAPKPSAPKLMRPAPTVDGLDLDGLAADGV